MNRFHLALRAPDAGRFRSACDPGFSCSGNGTRHVCLPGQACNATHAIPCAPGTYKDSKGVWGTCAATPAGWFAQDGAALQQCPLGFFCRASQGPQPVEPGYQPVGSIQGVLAVDQSICPPGRYSQGSGVQCELCPRGRYGKQQGLPSPMCEGACQAGYRCPPGSTNSTPLACSATGPPEYCPEGMELSTPPRADPGFAVEPENATFNGERQALCGPGFSCIDGRRTPCVVGRFFPGESNLLVEGSGGGRLPMTGCPTSVYDDQMSITNW